MVRRLGFGTPHTLEEEGLDDGFFTGFFSTATFLAAGIYALSSSSPDSMTSLDAVGFFTGFFLIAAFLVAGTSSSSDMSTVSDVVLAEGFFAGFF